MPTGIVKEKCDHVFEVSDKNKEKLNHIIDNYRLKISNAPLAKSINFPIKHCIDLKDDIPVSSPPRRIPYSLEKPIKSDKKTLFENDFIEKSNSQYASPKNGRIKIAVDYRL